MRWTISHGVAGLEAWAGTPGTVGGAIHGNAHFRGRLISELIDSVTLATLDGNVVDVPAAEMEFGYDYSRLHRTHEIVVAADFRVTEGTPEDAARRSRASRWRFASAPSRSSRPAPAASSRIPIPRAIACRKASRGRPVRWSIARVSRTRARDGARVSTTHANFIVNEGGASADEIRDLIERCKRDVRARFGVELREEIVYLGFGS